jgi:hypothetical protein
MPVIPVDSIEIPDPDESLPVLEDLFGRRIGQSPFGPDPPEHHAFFLGKQNRVKAGQE